MILYKRFSITGVASDEAESTTTLESIEGEIRRIISMGIYVTGWAGNQIQAFIDNTKVLDIEDKFCITDESSGSTNVQKDTGRPVEWPIDRTLEIGEKFRPVMTCGATNKNVVGYIKYEI